MSVFFSKSLFVILAFLGVLSVCLTPVSAETELTGPGTLNNVGEYYRLTKDISASGTAFTITADNVTLDLNEHTVTYDTSSGGNGVKISANRAIVKNGTIIQGNGKSSHSPVVYLSNGSGNELHHLILKPTGVKCYGISGRRNAEIHHVYIESHTTTSCDRGDGIAAIQLEGGSGSGDIHDIHDNILVNGHTGVVLIGGSQTTKVYNNLIQPKRRPGCKAPYGIGLSSKIHNVKVYNNQIISDNGRGIILDGWYQGAPEGASGNYIHDNRIDVQYSERATGGYYVENSVYGIRDRYSSGNNTFENNVIMTANGVDGRIRAFYVGSDSTDPLMTNILIQNNTIISRALDTSVPYGAFVFFWDYAQEITCINNNYYTDGTLQRNGNVDDLTFTGNNVLNPIPVTPIAPTALTIRKFLNSYLLKWNNNFEAGVFEYVVYRDGQKLPISPRGGTFYVDVDVGGTHTYSISALTLSGTEGPRCAEVSTTTAKNGWWREPSGGGEPGDAPSSPKRLIIIDE